MDDLYTCPVCGNRITKRPYPDTRGGSDPSRKRWGCQFCRSPLDAVFEQGRKGWKFAGFREAPRKPKQEDKTDRRKKGWQKTPKN